MDNIYYEFDDLVNDAKPGPLDQVSPPVGNTWAYTISPRKRAIPFNVCVLMDLAPYKEYILAGQMVMYPEFERDRLHYHGFVYTTNERYAHDYQFFTMASVKDRYHFTLKQCSGYTQKTHKPKYKTIAKGYHEQKACFVSSLRDGSPIDDKWLAYCTKHSDDTFKKLGYNVIDRARYLAISNSLLNDYILSIG